MTLVLPPNAVIRVSRVNFDPARFAEVDRMTHHTGTYLVPAQQYWLPLREAVWRTSRRLSP
jgi:phage terminase large subunit-like protein